MSSKSINFEYRTITEVPMLVQNFGSDKLKFANIHCDFSMEIIPGLKEKPNNVCLIRFIMVDFTLLISGSQL